MGRLVVVGAGLAGLACAERVAAAGHQVVVLEARTRLGGRVLTVRAGFGGQHAEAGGELVDADHVEVRALAARLGLALEPAAPPAGVTMVDAGGRLAPLEAWDQLSDGRLAAGLARWDDALDALDRERPGDLDDRHAAALVDRCDLSAVGRLVVGRRLRTRFGVPPDELSQLALLPHRHALRVARPARPARPTWRVAGGADGLAVGLAASLAPGTVRLATPVTALDAGGARTAAGELVAADVVVAAVPPPTLARIDATPALPFETLAAGLGLGATVHVQVARRLWRDVGRNGSVVSDRAHGELWEATAAQPGDAGILTVRLSSNDGAALAALPDLTTRVVAELERSFPGAGGLAGATAVTDWANDEWSLGTVPAWTPGQLTWVGDAVRRVHGRVVLAGDHTDDVHPGTMEGALRSGRRAAAQVLDLLRGAGDPGAGG